MESFKLSDPKDIPTDPCMGVFTSVRRKQAIETWPKDIHGCIGYWSPDYKQLPLSELYYDTLRVAFDAMYNDHRKIYFPPIEYDPHTRIEIDFMILPIYAVNDKGYLDNGEIFDNNEYGLIVEGTNRATYLPKVFCNTQWDEIKLSLDRKAGIEVSEKNKYYAYRIQQKSMELIEFIYDGIVTKKLIQDFLSFMKSSFDELEFVPSKRINRHLIVDKSDDIGNAANLYYTMRYNSLFQYEALDDLLKNNLLFYEYKIDTLSERVLRFLLPVIDLKYRSQIIEKLLQRISCAEGELAFFELVLGILEIDISIINYQIVSATCKNISFRKNLSDVFKWNLVSQVAFKLGIINPSHPNYDSQLENKYKKAILYILQNTEYINSIETVLLATIFEGLSVYNTDDILDALKFRIFTELMKRYKDGLLIFKDGSARIDSTCHFLNGLLNLEKR